jgi:hypothetical protein
LRRGPLTDRRRTFPGGWGVNRDKRYRRGRAREIAECRRRVSTPRPRSVSARRRPSQSRRPPRHACHFNIFHRRARISPGRRQSASALQSIPRWACIADRFAYRATRCRCFLSHRRKSVCANWTQLKLATSELVERHAARQFSPDHMSTCDDWNSAVSVARRSGSARMTTSSRFMADKARTGVLGYRRRVHEPARDDRGFVGIVD